MQIIFHLWYTTSLPLIRPLPKGNLLSFGDVPFLVILFVLARAWKVSLLVCQHRSIRRGRQLWSGVQTWIVIFPIDKLEGPFSPWHAAYVKRYKFSFFLNLICFKNLTKIWLLKIKSNMDIHVSKHKRFNGAEAIISREITRHKTSNNRHLREGKAIWAAVDRRQYAIRSNVPWKLTLMDDVSIFNTLRPYFITEISASG